MQCMMGAMTAGAGATGIRAWLRIRSPKWLTARRMKAVTGTLIGAALVAATVLLGGSGTSA
jgi:hypothetical protein